MVDHCADIQLVGEYALHSRLHPKIFLADVGFPLCESAPLIVLRRLDAPAVHLLGDSRQPVAVEIEPEYFLNYPSGLIVDVYSLGVSVADISKRQALDEPFVFLLLTKTGTNFAADVLCIKIVVYLLEPDQQIVVLI